MTTGEFPNDSSQPGEVPEDSAALDQRLNDIEEELKAAAQNVVELQKQVRLLQVYAFHIAGRGVPNDQDS